MSLAQSMDKLGPMCRSVEDCALILNIIKQTTARFAYDASNDLKSLKIGLDTESFAKVEDKAKAKLFTETVDRLKSEAGDLHPVKLPPTDTFGKISWLTIMSEGAANFSDLLLTGQIRQLAQQEEDRWPNTFRLGATIPAADYLRAQRLRRLLQREMDAALSGLDAYLTVPFIGPSSSYTNLCGQPSLTTRCAMLNNRPLSIEIIGNLYREDAILRIGAFISRAVGEMQWPDTTKLPD
jgi:Asp-tRNA(Asn)/Glu-tRNA(Gln) amidotransferase A subunit family amidase